MNEPPTGVETSPSSAIANSSGNSGSSIGRFENGLRQPDKLGAASCIILAASYLAVAMSYVFLSSGERVVGVGDAAEYYPALLSNPEPAYLLYWETTIIGIFGVAAVLSISETLGSVGQGWLGWTGQLAVFGFAVKALDSLRGLTLVKMRAEAWIEGGEATREAIGATRLTFDYHAWFSLGAVGAWILVVSLCTLRNTEGAKSVSYVGILLAIGNWLGVAGFATNSIPLLSICIASLGLLAPVWFGAWALRLIHDNRRSGPMS